MFQGVFKTINKGINKLIKTTNKYTIKGKDYFEERLLAEGGFGYVYLVEDPDTGQKYALKKMNILEKEQLDAIKREILYWKKINNHNNIVKMVEYDFNETNVFILMEFCSEGTLLDFINNRQEKNINENQALFIIQQVANGIYHMHSQNPPIAHRDIKIENVLKVGNNFKLCDFGSASVDTLDPKKESKVTLLENFSKFEKNTTFMYRPPEMCDPYSKFPIYEKVDVWMLGCILYALLFKQHPFQDAQKLTIINAHYYIPEDATHYSEKIIDFIRLMLTPNPTNRPSTKDVINIILNWDNIRVIDLPEETQEIKKKQIRNVKSNKNDLLTADDIFKAQQAILREQAKKNDDDDYNEIFDGIEIYDNKPKTKNNNSNNTIGSKLGENIKTQQIVNNNNYDKPFDPFNHIQSNNNLGSDHGEWAIDFNKGFINNKVNNNANDFEKSNKDSNFDFDFLDNSNKNTNNFNNLNNVFSVNNLKNRQTSDKKDFDDFIFNNKSNNQSNQVKVQPSSNPSNMKNREDEPISQRQTRGGFNFDDKFNNNFSKSPNKNFYDINNINNSMNPSTKPSNANNVVKNSTQLEQKKGDQNIYDFFK